MTQNAIGTNKPIEVVKGGSGASTHTDHGVLIGSGTGAITPLTVGATGELLVGVSGADPVFGTSADGAFTFTSATAATDRILTVSNTDNSDAGSAATLQLTTGGTSGGNAAAKWSITGGVNYSMGIDNAATGDPLKISNSNALGTTDSWVMTTAGERTMPLQPAFLAYLSATVNDVTGDGTSYTIVFDTEVFDQNGDYAHATGIFTAPITGRYVLCTTVQFIASGTGGYQTAANINTSNRIYYFGQGPTSRQLANFYGPNNCISWNGFVVADMDAADTAWITFYSGTSTKNDDIYGTNAPSTMFSGYLAV